jgi:hypothetical protein
MDHNIVFYDSFEKKKFILSQYLRNGLDKNQAAMYICSEETEDQIRKGMENTIDVEKEEKAGKLVICDYDGWYIENGKTQPLKIINKWKEAQSNFSELGLGLRATGEMSCFFLHDKVKELLKYEYALHRILKIPMEALCAYNLKTIVDLGYTEVIMPLIKAHGDALIVTTKGNMIIDSEKVELSDIERLIDLKI